MEKNLRKNEYLPERKAGERYWTGIIGSQKIEGWKKPQVFRENKQHNVPTVNNTWNVRFLNIIEHVYLNGNTIYKEDIMLKIRNWRNCMHAYFFFFLAFIFRVGISQSFYKVVQKSVSPHGCLYSLAQWEEWTGKVRLFLFIKSIIIRCMQIFLEWLAILGPQSFILSVNIEQLFDTLFLELSAEIWGPSYSKYHSNAGHGITRGHTF